MHTRSHASGPTVADGRGCRWSIVLAQAWLSVAAGCVLLAALCLPLAAVDGPEKWSFSGDVRPLLDKWCSDCHGDKKQKGGVNFAKYQNLDDVQRAAGRFEDVLHALREGDMPPHLAPQPSAEEREHLATWMEWALDSIDPAKQVRDPGHVIFHRLSRAEYDNTVRDLLGVDTHPADQFPADGGGGGGFDNNADTLFIPPLLLEKLVEAANSVLDATKTERLLIVKPTEDKPKPRREAAKATAIAFAKRAYRRPATPTEIERLLKVFDYCEKKSIAYEDSVRHLLKGALMSPSFLYRTEEAKPNTGAYELGQYEMASRLSYFLWSSMPDDELFALAEQKKLQDPQIIAQQVARMLKDPKARALSTEFTTQWLQIDELKKGGGGPDPGLYPAFNPTLRDAMCGEPVAFVAGLISDNRSILDLLDSDYTWVNSELARHYGMSGVSAGGSGWQRVKLTDGNRGGVTGMAAVLVATSYPTRTSPVLRGKWVLSQLLGAPPPPPPANVPSLAKEEPAKGEPSLRQRLEQHRVDPACAACHARIDPLGFGLENFDVLGVWRGKDARGDAIDAAGTLPNGESFVGSAGLRAVLMKRKEQFTRAFAGQLLSYALGRGIEGYDRVELKQVVKATVQDGYRIQALITAIATSYPFRFARNQPIVALEDKKEDKK
jgi:hypothetical protein